MSFLNPVNEPVKRFSSTDAGAPQINYAARTAGDVKAVLKACLVTGYGAKASAGWTAVNETATVIEFVSPSAAMSDYRLGIDDTSAASTTWYYQYQDLRTTPPSNSRPKSFDYIDKTSSLNGWELLVTDRGLYLIYRLYNSFVQKIVAQVVFIGQVKSTLSSAGKNIGFWIAGHGSNHYPYDFLGVNGLAGRHYNVGAYSALSWGATNAGALSVATKQYSTDIAVNTTSEMYLIKGSQIIALQPGMLLADINILSDIYGVKDVTISGRPALHVCLGAEWSSAQGVNEYSRVVIMPLDYWEY